MGVSWAPRGAAPWGRAIRHEHLGSRVPLAARQGAAGNTPAHGPARDAEPPPGLAHRHPGAWHVAWRGGWRGPWRGPCEVHGAVLARPRPVPWRARHLARPVEHAAT